MGILIFRSLRLGIRMLRSFRLGMRILCSLKLYLGMPMSVLFSIQFPLLLLQRSLLFPLSLLLGFSSGMSINFSLRSGTLFLSSLMHIPCSPLLLRFLLFNRELLVPTLPTIPE